MKKSYLILFLILNCSLPSYSQYMIKEWDYRFGGSNIDYLVEMKKTMDGGYILGGLSGSPASGDKSQGTQGGSDYWIVKINSNGIKQWDKRFGGSGSESLRGLLQTSDKGYLLGGTSGSGISGDKTQASRGGNDYWLVKTDSNGNKDWDYRYGGDSTDVLNALIENYPYGYVLGGYSKSTATGDKSQGSRGGYDYWIVYIDYFGFKIADFRFGGTESDDLTDIKVTSDGGLVLGGSSQSGISGDKTEGNRGISGTSDYWIVKLDMFGNKQWDFRFGGNKHDFLGSLLITSDNGFLLVGESVSDSSGDKTQGNQGGYDYWIVKLDSNGIKEWDYLYGGNEYDGPLTTKQTLDGGYIIGGYSYSNINGNKASTVTCSNFFPDYWLVKLNSNGLKQWEYSYGGDIHSGMNAVIQTKEGGYIMGGYSKSGIACDKTQASRGYDDYWIVKARPNWPNTDGALTITNAGITGKTLTWIKGNGIRRIVLVRAGSPITDTPTIGVNYQANPIYGQGQQVGNGNYVAYNGTGNTVTITGLNYNTTYYFKVIAFSPDTLFPIYQLSPYLSGNSTTLPVEWLDINAKALDENLVQLNWRTASETNNSHFEVERMENNNQWNAIGNKRGNGTTSIVSNYQYIDNVNGISKEINKIIYYRLKQIDFDGHYDYSKTVSVDFSKVELDKMTIYPNPFNDKLTIVSKKLAGKVKVEITNYIGSKVFEETHYLDGPQQLEINLKNIGSAGIYFLNVNGSIYKILKLE